MIIQKWEDYRGISLTHNISAFLYIYIYTFSSTLKTDFSVLEGSVSDRLFHFFLFWWVTGQSSEGTMHGNFVALSLIAPTQWKFFNMLFLISIILLDISPCPVSSNWACLLFCKLYLFDYIVYGDCMLTDKSTFFH